MVWHPLDDFFYPGRELLDVTSLDGKYIFQLFDQRIKESGD
jgi:hypothetical protein